MQLKVEIKAEMNSLTFDESKQTATVLYSSKDKKVRRRRVSLESDDEDENIETHAVDEELEKCIREPKMSEDLDPLCEFCKNRQSLYPRLAIQAKKYLAIQETSSPSERVVSKLNNLVRRGTGSLPLTQIRQISCQRGSECIIL